MSKVKEYFDNLKKQIDEYGGVIDDMRDVKNFRNDTLNTTNKLLMSLIYDKIHEKFDVQDLKFTDSDYKFSIKIDDNIKRQYYIQDYNDLDVSIIATNVSDVIDEMYKKSMISAHEHTIIMNINAFNDLIVYNIDLLIDAIEDDIKFNKFNLETIKLEL